MLVQVKACGIIPNMKNVMSHYAEWFPFLPLPPLPAIYGLDAAGVVAEVGSQVKSIKPGDRVYVNPGVSCGSCHACRRGEPINCDAYTFLGYFGFGPRSKTVFEDYPTAGFGEYMTAPASSIVMLPDAVSFEAGARFGYLGTAYSALRKAGARAGTSVLISGATGTLGLGAVILALAMGVTKVFGTARNKELLERVRAIAPDRVHVLPAGEQPIDEWVRARTDGLGADIFIDAVGPGAPHTTSIAGINALRRGGRMVDIGGMAEPLPLEMFKLMCFQISVIGSLWFSVAEGQDMAEMAAAGTLDLSVFEHQRFGLAEIEQALDAVDRRSGGFTNTVVMHG
ncbi:alcohol dehydrogenase catalytic domain-containing protein [Methylobacterium platani]|uniref:alcohol dehydrogenase catalytic domain-containing protein n=1 Tax=Methylobacterium platani TaxID=427683 RepID=UPI001FD7BF40|nr:zinc-binding dehydrogenase [Methylobacterium platani]